MKLSSVLYAVGFAFFTSAIVAEIVEKTQAKKRESELWQRATQSDGNGSSSSQPLQRQPQSSQTDSA
jgi:hypothetical protein